MECSTHGSYVWHYQSCDTIILVNNWVAAMSASFRELDESERRMYPIEEVCDWIGMKCVIRKSEPSNRGMGGKRWIGPSQFISNSVCVCGGEGGCPVSGKPRCTRYRSRSQIAMGT